MDNNLYQFWTVARWIFLAMYGVIVSAGAINASYAFARLAELDPAYTTESIYAILGVANLLLTAFIVYRGLKRDLH